MAVEIVMDELVAVFPLLDERTKMSIHVAVLERRLALAHAELEAAQRSIANYETYVKQGDLNPPEFQ